MARRISQDEKAKGGPEFGEADEEMLGAGFALRISECYS